MAALKSWLTEAGPRSTGPHRSFRPSGVLLLGFRVCKSVAAKARPGSSAFRCYASTWRPL